MIAEPAPSAAGAAALPEPIRRQLVDLAAEALGRLSADQVPAPLRRVYVFAPNRRARAGAAPLAVALDRDPAFRHQVAAIWRELHPELGAALQDGAVPPAADPALAAAGTYLLRPPQWQTLLEPLLQALAEQEERAVRRQTGASAEAATQAISAELTRLREVLARAQARIAELEEELAAARRDQRRLRSEADRARAAARAAGQERDAERERSAAAQAAAEQAVRQAEEQARQAAERVEQAARAARDGRSLADLRVRLLLDTIVDSASGLRRELALPPATVSPADLVAGASASGTGTGAMGQALGQARGRPEDDPALLDQLLRLPRAHLVVDGYNVTKTGYGTMPLAEQRRRLIGGLSRLAARTAAEVTCCFDGAQVEGRSAELVNRVRVLFSEPGITADELIRRLVRAEPAGRVVVVVSSDAEVVGGVRASGARAVPAGALLNLLDRG